MFDAELRVQLQYCDGNGRLARLVGNALLIKAGRPACVFEERAFLEALRSDRPVEALSALIMADTTAVVANAVVMEALLEARYPKAFVRPIAMCREFYKARLAAAAPVAPGAAKQAAPAAAAQPPSDAAAKG